MAGLLVGFGTKLSNGCTSGHGLCGIPRLSIRSIVAVITFMLFAMAISTLRYYVNLGPFTDESLNPQLTYNHLVSANICIALGILFPFIGGIIKSRLESNTMNNNKIAGDQAITFFVGFIFGCGLLLSGMVRRVNIMGFLGLG